MTTGDMLQQPPQASRVGKVEIWFQAGVYVLLEDGGVIQVRHGVEDQRSDPIRLSRQEAIELAYLLLWAADGRDWTAGASSDDIARLLHAFREVVEVGDREAREALERMDEMYRSVARP